MTKNNKVDINIGYKERIINSDVNMEDIVYMKYRDEWVNNPIHKVVGDKPLFIAIESTNNCNLMCLFCYRTKRILKGNYRNIGFFNYTLYKKVINELSELGVYSIKLNKDGEPLMHPQILNMVKYAKDKGIMEVMFNTNAMLLTENVSRSLIESGLDKILISFDSPYKDKYNHLRACSDYDLVLDNIVQLKKIKTELGSDKPHIRINMIKMNNTTDEEIKAFNDLFEPYADTIAIQDYSDFADKEVKKDFCCQELWQRLVIFWDGNVVPCCGDLHEESVLGNVKVDSIRDIWKGDKLNKIRKVHIDNESVKIPMCKRCCYQML